MISSNTMSPFKVVLISTSVLSAAVMLAVTDFLVYVPSIYDGLVSWLRPPYLYLVINCIVLTIVVSSKIQSRKDEPSPSPNTLGLDAMTVLQPIPAAAAPSKISHPDYDAAAEYKYNGVVLENTSGYQVKAEDGLPFAAYEQQMDARAKTEQEAPFVVSGAAAPAEDAMSNKENEHVIAKSKWSAPAENSDSTEYSPSYVKPPASARFGHRRNVKASPEGGKTVLGVSKTKKQDTLESTWKTITEGRAIPITRHLRKSDTWERDSHVHGAGRHQPPPEKTMAKSETFNDRTNTRSPSPGSSGKPKREASLGQDELNRRVEAFIKKFNEEMRLQRQESLNQYMEMINRGAH